MSLIMRWCSPTKAMSRCRRSAACSKATSAARRRWPNTAFGRPPGVRAPPVDIRPARTQVDDLVGEVRATAQAGYRSLVTVLTKRMAEDLTEYLHEQGIRVRYMHSDIHLEEKILLRPERCRE